MGDYMPKWKDIHIVNALKKIKKLLGIVRINESKFVSLNRKKNENVHPIKCFEFIMCKKNSYVESKI